MKALAAAVAALALAATPVLAKPKPMMPVPKPVPTLTPEAQAALLRDDALQSNAAYKWVSDITTRFGARPAGSARERAAGEWAAAELKKMGFDTAVV